MPDSRQPIRLYLQTAEQSAAHGPQPIAAQHSSHSGHPPSRAQHSAHSGQQSAAVQHTAAAFLAAGLESPATTVSGRTVKAVKANNLKRINRSPKFGDCEYDAQRRLAQPNTVENVNRWRRNRDSKFRIEPKARRNRQHVESYGRLIGLDNYWQWRLAPILFITATL